MLRGRSRQNHKLLLDKPREHGLMTVHCSDDHTAAVFPHDRVSLKVLGRVTIFQIRVCRLNRVPFASAARPRTHCRLAAAIMAVKGKGSQMVSQQVCTAIRTQRTLNVVSNAMSRNVTPNVAC